ncbi:MAG: helix-hairpin-helix domain-containing protein [Deltaproteobacteria bacterium]
MKREVPKENGARRSADAGEGEKNQSRDIALLVIAVFLVAIYFVREFYIPGNPAPATSTPPVEKTVFEIQEPPGFSKVYTSPKDISLKDAMAKTGRPPSSIASQKQGLKNSDSPIKSGSKITISKDGSVQIGQMSGEKHIVFSIPLDINRATAQDFEALPGIGPKLAEEIIATRKRLGGFKTVDDLKKVKGIGDKKFEKIREKISVE